MTSDNTTRPQWRKSSRSGGAQQCVEVATNVPSTSLIRDSKLGDQSPILNVASSAFATFLNATANGRFD